MSDDDVFPPPAPPAKKLRTTPLPKDSIVTGYSQTGLFGFPTHKHHGLFEIVTKPHKAEHSNSGFQQTVVCITCSTIIEKVDCEFLMVRGTKAEAQQVIAEINKAKAQLIRARRYYSDLINEGRVKP